MRHARIVRRIAPSLTHVPSALARVLAAASRSHRLSAFLSLEAVRRGHVGAFLGLDALRLGHLGEAICG
jgi:hypothetical protein